MGPLSFSLLALLASLERPLELVPREQPLVTIVSEPQRQLEHQIFLTLDADGGIVQLVRRSTVSETVTIATDFLRGRVALAGQASLFLSCPSCDPRTGGPVLLEYLHNGMTGRYASCSLRLEKTDGSFQLTTENGRPVRRLRLTARRVLGVLVGIGDVVAE